MRAARQSPPASVVLVGSGLTRSGHRPASRGPSPDLPARSVLAATIYSRPRGVAGLARGVAFVWLLAAASHRWVRRPRGPRRRPAGPRSPGWPRQSSRVGARSRRARARRHLRRARVLLRLRELAFRSALARTRPNARPPLVLDGAAQAPSPGGTAPGAGGQLTRGYSNNFDGKCGFAFSKSLKAGRELHAYF